MVSKEVAPEIKPVEKMHELLKFNNEKLLLCALTHRSYVNENPEAITHNERLEFLGDGLLNFLCAEYLYNLHPELGEDEMTRQRAGLVDEKQLAKFAIEIGLEARMRLGKGVIREGGYQNENLLSSTFEAVVAAYYLDKNGDINKLRNCIIPLFESVPKNLFEARASVDPKNRFQEVVHATKINVPPKYETTRIGGEDHAPEFLSIAYVNGQEWGQGLGKCKKEAEKNAAKEALSNWQAQH